MSYHHFTIEERESILVYRTQGLNLSQIAKLLHRYPSSISREWKRHLKRRKLFSMSCTEIILYC